MNKKYLIIALIALLLLVLSGVCYYFFVIDAGDDVEIIPANEIEEQFQQELESLDNLFGDDL